MIVENMIQPPTEPVEWNIHEIIEPCKDDEMVRVQAYSPGDGRVFVPIRFYGYEYWVLPTLWPGTDLATNDIIRICYTFPNERQSRNIVLPSLRQDDLFIDVGAAYGSWTLPAAAMHCKVMAFEPDSLSATILGEHIKINKFEKRVQVVRDSVSVKPTQSIDRWNLDKVRLIKIDTEGSEFDVLQSAKKTINKCRPNLLVELHTQMHGKEPKDEIEFLTNLCPQFEYHHYILPQKSREQDQEYYHIYHFL